MATSLNNRKVETMEKESIVMQEFEGLKGTLKYRSNGGVDEIECVMDKCVKKGEYLFMTYTPTWTQRPISACFWAKQVLFVAYKEQEECVTS